MTKNWKKLQITWSLHYISKTTAIQWKSRSVKEKIELRCSLVSAWPVGHGEDENLKSKNFPLKVAWKLRIEKDGFSLTIYNEQR